MCIRDRDITTSILEDVRKRLRSLVKFIEKTKRQNIYTDFADLIGEEREIEFPEFGAVHDVERFRDKTEQFLKAHGNDPVIAKLRWNEPLSKADLEELEKMLIEAGAGTADDLTKVRSGSGLGLFVRSMVGLDREAAKRAFDQFLAGRTFTANQIQFVNQVIDYLTQSGWMKMCIRDSSECDGASRADRRGQGAGVHLSHHATPDRRNQRWQAAVWPRTL